MKRVLITGVCGFVGSTIAKTWLEAESNLVLYGIDSFIRPGSEYNWSQLQKLGVKLFRGDIRLASDLETLPEVDWVLDAAANPSVLAGVDGQTSSRQLVEHNLCGTINILEFCKRCGSGLILLSTSRVYAINPLAALQVEPVSGAFRLSPGQILPPGLTCAGVSEEFSTEAPISLYGSSKRSSEIMALEYGETYGFPVWINRCGVLAGAGQFGRADQGIFAFWINSWLRKTPLAYIGFGGKGYQVRDCLHPRDLIPLLNKQTSQENAVETRLINVGGGADNAMSLAELSAWCQKRLGLHSVASNAAMRRFDIPWLIMDTAKAAQCWGWQPQTSITHIVEEIACHAEQHPQWLELSRM